MTLSKIDEAHERDLRAESAHDLWFALIHAFEHRVKTDKITARELAAAIGKEPSYVSRLMRGRHTPDFATLKVFFEALRFDVKLQMRPFEDIPRPNFDAQVRPTSQSSTIPGVTINQRPRSGASYSSKTIRVE